MPPAVTIGVPYAPPERHGKRIHGEGVRWRIEIDDPTMRERGEFVMRLDPSLPDEDVAGAVHEVWGRFLCRYCGSPLVFNGQNGAGTPSLRCKRCRTNMSVWNTFELTVWRYKKILGAALHTVHGGSVESASRLYGVGRGALAETMMCLPQVKYSREGPLEVVDYDGEEFGVVTSDMMYKGRRGVMLGVCGGLEVTEFGNESTGEGLEEFLDEVEARVATERYLFVMDARLNVAKRILERFGERAVVVLQNHTTWGDVQVFFHREGWYTLRLRTDAFSEPSMKRDEAALLTVGEVELYEGLRGLVPGGSLRDVTTARLREKVEELLVQVGNADWERGGRVDLVMRPKLMKLNGLLRELDRRGDAVDGYFDGLRALMDGLVSRYSMAIRRVLKKKIVNAYRALTVMEEDVERLSEAILREPLPAKAASTGHGGSHGERVDEGLVRFLGKPRLLYRGDMNGGSVPEPARWVLGLLREVFDGMEITTNACEGRFGVLGMSVRRGRSIYLERAMTRVHLQRQGLGETCSWLVESHPIQDMGKRGERGSRVRFEVGGRYEIAYVDRLGQWTRREIEVLKRGKKRIVCYCHLREEERTFNRGRIRDVIRLSSGLQ